MKLHIKNWGEITVLLHNKFWEIWIISETILKILNGSIS